MTTIFSRIVAGELPAHRVAEDDRFLAFLDIRPIAEGHTLVIPKQETDYLFDLDDAILGDLMVFAKRVAVVLRREVACARVGVMVAGLEVPHAHVHLVPFQEMSQLTFAHAKPADPTALAILAQRIRAGWEKGPS